MGRIHIKMFILNQIFSRNFLPRRIFIRKQVESIEKKTRWFFLLIFSETTSGADLGVDTMWRCPLAPPPVQIPSDELQRRQGWPRATNDAQQIAYDKQVWTTWRPRVNRRWRGGGQHIYIIYIYMYYVHVVWFGLSSKSFQDHRFRVEGVGADFAQLCGGQGPHL